MELFVITY